MKAKVMKGYKIFNPDFTCKGYKFEENKEFTHKGKLVICESGFHFCIKASDCFSYYSFDPNNIVCEVEARGTIVKEESGDSKCATDILFVGKKLSWQEVLVVANEGNYNTGRANSGNSNSGDWNSGNRNSGDSNSGNRNSGDSNSGNRNSGDWNSGNRNSGYRNSGYRNSGYSNSGDWNSGNRNSGDSNSGDWNSGDSNSGDWNSGDSNSGNRNSGYRNSGDWNSGNRNSGDSNSGYRNSGAFCTDNNPVIWLFDKPTSIKVKEWEKHEAISIMKDLLENTIWIEDSLMSKEEKKTYPSYETTGGYLKVKTMHEAWADMWNNLNEAKKKIFTSLPNFDAKKFKIITGINV